MSNRKNKKKSSDLLPENCQLEICGASGFGDLMAAAVDPTDNPHGYKIYVLENKKIKPALAEGDRFIARLSRKNDTWWAKPLARTMTAGDQELCARMLDTSIAVSRVLTVARRSAGIRFPGER